LGKRGSKPAGKIKTEWNPKLAYVIGLIASDGCLSNDKRHITVVSKDKDQLQNILACLKINVKIGRHNSGAGRFAYRIQFGDVLFYGFLENIGLTSAKSKTIAKLDIPDKYFFDFLRGLFDGDGYFYSYTDPKWKSSFMFYTGFVSASKKFIDWLQETISSHLNIMGHITTAQKTSIYYQLKYAKADSLKILERMYQGRQVVCLSRKRLKINNALGIIGRQF
jgi:hypothetical protein